LGTISSSLAIFCAHRELGGCERSRNSLLKVTYLTFWDQGCYFLVAALHTAIYASSGTAPLDRFPRLLQRAHAALYTSVVVLPIFATVGYWGFVNEGQVGSPFHNWRNILVHGINAAFAIFEIIVPRTEPPNSWHSCVLTALSALYLALVYLVGTINRSYPCKFLNPGEREGWEIGSNMAILFLMLWSFYVIE
jgi:hypothetical protein